MYKVSIFTIVGDDDYNRPLFNRFELLNVHHKIIDEEYRDEDKDQPGVFLVEYTGTKEALLEMIDGVFWGGDVDEYKSSIVEC